MGECAAIRDITFRDLLTHTAGLTNANMAATQVDALYREAGIDFTFGACSLGEMVERLAGLPLLAQPGTQWNYSVATDVLGHLVAVISGQPFDAFMEERIIRPLGMVDTGFDVPAEKLSRLAANYGPGKGGELTMIDDPADSCYAAKRPIALGGGGLVSTASDYVRFCRMMLNKGELDGVRLLGRKTVELMTSNHLRGDMADMGQPRFSESTYEGIGFGLAFPSCSTRPRRRSWEHPGNMPGVASPAPPSGSIRRRKWRCFCSHSSCPHGPTRSAVKRGS